MLSLSCRKQRSTIKKGKMKKQNQIKEIESHIKNLSENLREMLKYGSNETTRDYSREIRANRETLKALKS